MSPSRTQLGIARSEVTNWRRAIGEHHAKDADAPPMRQRPPRPAGTARRARAQSADEIAEFLAVVSQIGNPLPNRLPTAYARPSPLVARNLLEVITVALFVLPTLSAPGAAAELQDDLGAGHGNEGPDAGPEEGESMPREGPSSEGHAANAPLAVRETSLQTQDSAAHAFGPPGNSGAQAPAPIKPKRQRRNARRRKYHVKKERRFRPSGKPVLRTAIENMPTRRQVAREILREHNIDPQQKFTVTYRYPDSEPDEVDMAAEDIYMEYSLNIPILDASARSYPSIFGTLPDLDEKFDERIDAYTEQMKRDAAHDIILEIGNLGIHAGDKFAVSWVKSAKRSEDWMTRKSTDGAILRIENSAGESRYVAIVPNHTDLVMSIPQDEAERLDWLQVNQHLFFGDELGHLEWGRDYVTFDDPESSLLDTILGRTGSVIESNLREAVEKITDHIFTTSLREKKKEAYEESEMQTLNNMHRTMMFPPYGLYEAKRQYNLGDDQAAAKEVAFVSLSALPAVAGGAVKAIDKGARLATATKVVIKVGKSIKTGKAVITTGVRTQQTVGRLARVITKNARSRVGRRLARGGVCWDAVIDFEKEVGLIPASRAQTLHTVTRAGQFSEFLKNARSVATPTEFSKVAAGQRIGFVAVEDNMLKHAMVSTGHGKAIGVNNGFLDPKLSPGWAEIDLTKSLRWEGGLVRSADGKVAMRVMVARPA